MAAAVDGQEPPAWLLADLPMQSKLQTLVATYFLKIMSGSSEAVV